MPRKLLSHPYEIGCSEAWSYKTDVLQSVTGAEQRISLLEYPDEILGITIAFGDDGQQAFDGEPEISGQEAIVRSLNDLVACQGEVEVPLWHLSDSITGATWTTGTRIADLTIPASGPFHVFVGEDVLVDTGSVWRRAEVTAYSQLGGTLTVDFGSNTGAAATDLAELAPLRTGLASTPGGFDFARAAHVASLKVSVFLDRRQGRTGFSGGSGLNVATPDGAPLLSLRGIQDDFGLTVDHGLETIAGPTGFPYYVTNWDEAKFSGKFRDSFRRTQGDRFRYWRTLLSTLRGSQGHFWLPTRRGEFTVLSADSDLQIITLEGRQFFDLWSETNLKALCLDDLGDNLVVVHVSAVELSGDNSVLSIADAWFTEPIRQCSLALPVRIADDKVSWEHDAGSAITFAFKSAPYTFPVLDDPVDWEGLLAQIDASSIAAEFDGEFRYVSVPIVGELGGEVTVISGRAGPEQSPVNSLRAMAFEDIPFDPTLGGTLDVHLWADTLLAQFRIGTSPADLQFEGEGEIPRIFILAGGEPETPAKPLGVARYIKSWEDPATAIAPSRATAPVRYEGTWRLEFADTTYFEPDWTPPAVGMHDRSGHDNHLFGSEGSEAWRQNASERYGIDPGDTWSAEGIGMAAAPILVGMVGQVDSSSGTRILARITGTAARRVELTTGGAVRVVGAGTSSSIGSLADGDWFALLVVFDGSSSAIHLLKNDDTSWTSGTVDDGNAVDLNVDEIEWISDGVRRHALLLSEVPADIPAFREQFARHYEFQSLVSQTGVEAATADIDGWAVLHDGSTDYVLSVVLDIATPGPATITLFEVLNNAENGGLRWEWTKATDVLTVTYIGTAGTFTDTFDLTAYVDLGYPMIVELRFDESTPNAELFVNGDSLGTFAPAGFTFSSVQQNALLIGEQRGWRFCELRLREGSTLDTDDLAFKWQSVASLLFDEDFDLVIDGDSSLVIGW